MKLVYSTLLLLFLSVASNAQNVLGKYNQLSIIAPKQYRDSMDQVEIVKDTKHNKVIWIKHLIPGYAFYAIKNVEIDEYNAIYAVPKQQVGNYQINLGCIIYTAEEDEEDQVVIVLNNKTMCSGMTQSDFQTEVSIGKGGVKNGGVEIGLGGIKVKDVKIGKEGVSVNTKTLMTGIQYVGNK